MSLGLVWATHPATPNTDGNARGRALHLREDGNRLTLCNMLFDRKADDIDKSMFMRKRCKTCGAKAGTRPLPNGWRHQ
jgi:hypothetical protein